MNIYTVESSCLVYVPTCTSQNLQENMHLKNDHVH